MEVEAPFDGLLIWYGSFSLMCGKSVNFDRICRTFVEVNLGSTHDAPSGIRCRASVALNSHEK